MKNFLKCFLSYGSILHFHDIPSLRNYMVTTPSWIITPKKQLQHSVYWNRIIVKMEMIFRFLTNLQITFLLITDSYYCHVSENCPSNESFYIFLFIVPLAFQETWQACLIQYLMKIPQFMWVPTQPINSTMLYWWWLSTITD